MRIPTHPDAVAYHREGKPVLGSAAFVHTWNGADWRFASAANRDAFAASPEQFAPQYGGYCAYGTSQGYKVSTQPDAFAIVDGKLYLNYSKPVQATWNTDRPGFIRVANEQWQTLEHAAYTSGKRVLGGYCSSPSERELPARSAEQARLYDRSRRAKLAPIHI